MGGDAAAGRHHGWHERGFEKMAYWVRGPIVFRVAGGGTGPGPGDNMVLLRFTAPGGFLPAWTATDHDVR